MIPEFERFVKEQKYLKGVSGHTIAFYKQSFKTYQRVLSGSDLALAASGKLALLENLPTKHTLKDFVTGMREQGMKPVTCNTYIRGMNSYLTWLFENGHITEPLKIKQLKCEQRVMRTFSDRELSAIVSFKPKGFCERRLYALVLLALDTGCRISELLTLDKEGIDFDNLLIRVKGKGNKERVVPFSFEVRKVLWKFTEGHQFNVVFPNTHGGRLLYDNCRRDYNRLLKKIGIEKCDQSFHSLRRAFAKNYVKSGGDVFHLQRTLGHRDLKTTRSYVDLDTEDLSVMHRRTSLLSRLR